MEKEILESIKVQDAKLDAIWSSVEKTRKYFLIVMWATIAMIVLPLIAMAFVLPFFLKTYLGAFEDLL
jgi:hypothetical protein